MKPAALAVLIANLAVARGLQTAKAQPAAVLHLTANSSAAMNDLIQRAVRASEGLCVHAEAPVMEPSTAVSTHCMPDNDPHYTIGRFITDELKGGYRIMSRPVNGVARALMCGKFAVGKGFDIKSKSSKLGQPETFNGLVPFCQMCLTPKQWAHFRTVGFKDIGFKDDIGYDPASGVFQFPENVSHGSALPHAAQMPESVPQDTCAAPKVTIEGLKQPAAHSVKQRRAVAVRTFTRRLVRSFTQSANATAGVRAALRLWRHQITGQTRTKDVVPFCSTYNIMCQTSNVCYSSYREPDGGLLQHKSFLALRYPHPTGQEGDKSADPTPPGVDARTCVALKSELLGSLGMPEKPVRMPFLAYKTGTTVKPVVSDYDLLMVAECTAGYPQSNQEPAYYERLAGLVDIIAHHKGDFHADVGGGSLFYYSDGVHSPPTATNWKDQIDAANSEVPIKDIGLLSAGLCNHVLGPLIHTCNEAGHGAVRHGSENENIIFPQTFEQRDYPVWGQDGNFAGETFTEKSVRGPLGVQEEFRQTLLTHHCCVAINPWWLTAYFHRSMNKDARLDRGEAELHAKNWQDIWVKATQVPALKEKCPYYGNEKVVSAYRKLVDMRKVDSTSQSA